MIRTLAIAAPFVLAAATVVPPMFQLIYPAQVWGVADTEPLAFQVVDGMPSFRRPGDAQCLEKFNAGPIPCDEIDTFDLIEFQEIPITEHAPIIKATLPTYAPTLWRDPVQEYCCNHVNPPPPPVLPSVPLFGTFWFMLTGIGVIFLRQLFFK